VGKDDPRVIAFGDVDELNAQIGLAAATIPTDRADAAWDALKQRLGRIQSDLFDLGAELATPAESARRPASTLMESRVAELEAWIDEATARTPPLSNFVLPGGTVTAAQLHLCRTVCRRAECAVVALGRKAAVNPRLLIYLNRLSDLFFAWARLANAQSGVSDIVWNAGQAAPRGVRTP
jgi:cob(I)alamin adenosyltransferase